MRCTKCNAEIDDYDITCPFCGQKTSEVYIRDVAELKQQIKENTPTITFSDIIYNLLCDKKDDSSGTRIAFLFFMLIFIAILIVVWSIVDPLSWFNFSDSWCELFDSFWSLLGLKPGGFLTKGGKGDIRVLITMFIVFFVAIRYVTGKDRSGDDNK